jgi:anti-sigma B factor antagonist
MEWQVEAATFAVIGRPIGKIDETTWEAFQVHLLAAVGQAAEASLPLVIDLAALDYMSSRGLRVLKIAKDAAGPGAPITLAAPNDRMRQIIEISRYDMLFKVVADVASAT